MKLLFLCCIILVQMLWRCHKLSGLPMCIKIGNDTKFISFIIDAPENGKNLSIKLPDEYVGLPITANYLPPNATIFENPDPTAPC